METVLSYRPSHRHVGMISSITPRALVSGLDWSVSGSPLPMIDISATTKSFKKVKDDFTDANSVAASTDSFAGNSLVDAPRLIMSENTIITHSLDERQTPLLKSLTKFYNKVTLIPHHQIKEVTSEVKSLMEYIMPRAKKLGNASGLKVKAILYTGKLFDGTQVMDSHDVDVLILFDRFKTKLESLEEGYKMIPLRRYRFREGARPDQWRYGRSKQGLYLSPYQTNLTMYELIKRSVLMREDVSVNELCIEDGQAPITLVLNNTIRIHITPACEGDRPCYLTTRPYDYDSNPSSDMLWRCDYTAKERKIIQVIQHADRGVRHQAYLLLVTLVRCEPTLQALTTTQITNVMLHWCDDLVDKSPRWQRSHLEECFMELLAKLRDFLAHRYLPHFFCRDQNMLAYMPTHAIERVRTRVAYLCQDRNEITRIVKKRTKEWLNKTNIVEE